MHQGTVTIRKVTYPVTVLRDTAAQQSVCRNVTGISVGDGDFVLCCGLSGEKMCEYVFMDLDCPVVKTSAKVAMMDSLPIEGVDFLLGCDLAGDVVFPAPVGLAELNLDVVESAGDSTEVTMPVF